MPARERHTYHAETDDSLVVSGGQVHEFEAVAPPVGWRMSACGHGVTAAHPRAWGIYPKCAAPRIRQDIGRKVGIGSDPSGLYLTAATPAGWRLRRREPNHEPNFAVRHRCCGVCRCERGRTRSGHRNCSSRPCLGPQLPRRELPGFFHLHSLVPGRPAHSGEPGHHVGLERLPRLVLELGGDRGRRLQHHLPVAWHSA